MNEKRIEALFLIPVILLVACVVMMATSPAESYNPPSARYPQTAPGFKAMDNITATTAAAIKIGAIPAGYRAVHVRAAGGNVNYGGSDVSTATTHLFIPDGEVRSFGYFDRPSPDLYFRTRGTTPATVYIDAGPLITKPW